MLRLFRKLFHSQPPALDDPGDMSGWADARRYVHRGVRSGLGFVIEGHKGPHAWRMEWGPAQRSYIDGGELRLRAELELPPELQALVLNRELQAAMEAEVFDQYVEGVQTRVDTQTPPEMRWLVMYPKLHGTELKDLREHWAAVSSMKPWVQAWLAGDLAAALAASRRPGHEAAPVVLMITRGRLTLRTAVAEPQAREIEHWLQLFETALVTARRTAAEYSDTASPSTQPSMWAASAAHIDLDACPDATPH